MPGTPGDGDLMHQGPYAVIASLETEFIFRSLAMRYWRAPMISQASRQEVLTQAWEDWSGLWEAAWGIRSQQKELSPEAAVEEAKATLKSLLSEELVYVCWLDNAQQETRLSRRDAKKVIEAIRWEAPQVAADQFWFATTEKGDLALHKIWAEASS